MLVALQAVTESDSDSDDAEDEQSTASTAMTSTAFRAPAIYGTAHLAADEPADCCKVGMRAHVTV